jgi:4-amino-4-deoxy-L-arabinose transferase-like glycosyltransferase
MSLSLQRRANALLAGFVVVGAVLYSFPPQEYHFYPVCPLYAFTHLLCPGCGGTRALYQLLHLHFSEAWRLNALVTVAAPVALLWFFFWYDSVMRYHRSPQIRLPRVAVAGLYAVVVLFAIVRNAGLAFTI